MKVSIIIPFFNTELKYLEYLFNSINSSEKNNLEFIFVNDGSNEATSQFVKDFCLANNFIFIDSNGNFGVSHARNLGIKSAKYKQVMFVDSDDDADFSFVNNLEENENIDLYLFKDRILTKELSNFKNDKLNVLKNEKNLFELYFLNSNGLNLRSSCCKIFNKNILDTNNLLFNEKLPYYEDAFFMCKYYTLCNNYLAYNNVIYSYRLYSQSSSKRFNKNYFEKYSIYFSEFKKEFANNELLINSLYLDTFKKVLIDKFIRSLKKFHFLYAYKILKLNIISQSANFIIKQSDIKSFDYKLANKIIRKHYLCAFNLIIFSRLRSSISIRFKKLLKK